MRRKPSPKSLAMALTSDEFERNRFPIIIVLIITALSVLFLLACFAQVLFERVKRKRSGSDISDTDSITSVALSYESSTNGHQSFDTLPEYVPRYQEREMTQVDIPPILEYEER